MNIIVKEDHISIHDDGEEIFYWHKQEWHEDPDLIISICNAIVIALSDPDLARETFEKILTPEEEKNQD